MIAAKHLDPVIGVDIHLIQPPGPVPPVPIPHPFVGFLIDPADYVPIVGSTVLINNLHRAQAGTAGKCVPPHIPIGGVFVPPPPGNECEMFMGSATVECDGDALSYMGLPALSCQSVGMPSIPRVSPKKKTIPKCLMLPTSQVLAIPAGPPVMVGGPPTISIMGMAMKAGAAALGKLAKAFKKIQKKSKRWKALSKRLHEAAKKAMDKLGVPPSARNRVHRAICSVTGHPVDIATGKVFTDAVDFQLPGPLPLVWERVWFSTSTYNGPLGRGWHHSYDLGLVDEGEAVAIRLPDGRPVAFPPIEPGESVFDRTERLTLRRDSDGYLMQDSNGLQFRFGTVTFDTPVQKLLSVTDRSDFRIQFGYDRHGHLCEVIDSGGRRLSVLTDADGRITQIRGPHPDEADATIPLVSYDYDFDGQLVGVRDALDQPMRFQYNLQGLLVRETNPNGLTFSFEYDGTDHSARCIRTWGDGGIYDHRLEYDADLKRTIVTNSLGHRTVHFWNDSGVVVRAIDPLGKSAETTFNEFNQPVMEIDELGLQTAYEYDSRGNQTALVKPDGTSLQVSYNENDLPLKAIDAIGCVWKWSYNSRGQLTKRLDGSGHETKFGYSGNRLTSLLDPANQETVFVWDTSGNLECITTPDGTQTRWQYDWLGRPTAVTIPAGMQRRTYDLLGRIVQVAEPDGNLRSLTYDSSGNLVHAKDLQHDVRFTYQGMGRMASRREAGTTVEFRYNTEEDLIGIVNEHGCVYRFELDERREVTREFGFDNIRRIYTRDDAGRVVRVERASGLITWYEYDLAGRVVSVRHSDKSAETFVYRADGELMEATNNACTIKFERDPSGRILKEWQDDYWVSSCYDANGFRKEIRSCFGAIQRIERNAMGDVVGMQYADALQNASKTAWESRIQRDAMGLEIERSLPGGIRSRWERDKLGRPIHHQLLRDNAAGSRDVRYQWDVSDRLQRIVDAHHGTTTFEHDVAGNLAAAVYDNGTTELRMPDAVGNLFRTKERRDRKYGKAGQILESRDETGITKYEYDAEGNLTRKSTPQGDWFFHWNATGMLRSVQRPDGEIVEFSYDPLGRRIRKSSQGRTTRWIWDGNCPLHEWLEGPDVAKLPAPTPPPPESIAAATAQQAMLANPPTGPPPADLLPAPCGLITWLFEPESFSPVAKLVDGERYSIVTDYLGTPCAMLDQFGRTVWSASISIYGDLRNLVGDRHACPFRWPGQYEDQETGYCYNRWRYYDAREGEFISQDPLKLEAGTTRLVGYPLDPLKAFDPLGLKSGAGYDHVTYQGIKNGRAYTGYASAPSSMGLTPEQIVSRRYGGNFSDFGGQPPSVRYSGSGIEGKSTARGLEQRLFERDVATLGRNNVANLQNPVGINNPRRTAYLQAADKKLGLCG